MLTDLTYLTIVVKLEPDRGIVYKKKQRSARIKFKKSLSWRQHLWTECENISNLSNKSVKKEAPLPTF